MKNSKQSSSYFEISLEFFLCELKLESKDQVDDEVSPLKKYCSYILSDHCFFDKLSIKVEEKL
jgi:hypothetical protein